MVYTQEQQWDAAFGIGPAYTPPASSGGFWSNFGQAANAYLSLRQASQPVVAPPPAPPVTTPAAAGISLTLVIGIALLYVIMK